MNVNYNFKQIDDYLTESNLFEFLKDFLPNTEIIHNKTVPNSGIRNRPDFRIEDLKLIIEFDGNRHFQQTNVILSDMKKDQVYSDMGYVIKRIPYFLQLDEIMIMWLFEDKLDLDLDKLKPYTIYPHGFIDEKCILPADYSTLGLKKFSEVYNKFFSIYDNLHKKIDFTLIDKSIEYNSLLKVFPLDYDKMMLKLLIEHNGNGIEYNIHVTENLKYEYEIFYK